MRTPLIAVAFLVPILLAPSAAAQTTLQTFQGTQGDESHGHSVANAGDWDGDGFDDVIVGSPFYDLQVFPNQLQDSGRAFVRSGATGDTLFLVYGEGAAYNLGFDVDGAGDINNDGFADVIVGVPGKQSGSFTVYFGPDGDVALETTLNLQGQEGFATSVAGCGDANGDGHDDVVIGSPFETVDSIANAGRIVVYDVYHQNGFAVANGTQTNGHLGWSVDGAGDVDGDGRADVLAGEPHRDFLIPGPSLAVDAGRISVFSTVNLHMTPLLHVTGSLTTGGEFGYAVAGGGLIDGDGVPDLIVGAPGVNGDIGEVRVISGATGTLIDSSAGSQGGERFGAAVAAGGDFDGDGLPDLIAGAPSYDLGLLVNRGRIEVRTAATGALLHQSTSLSGGQIGFSVDIGAHTDIDARDEILYGAPFDDVAAPDAGASFVVSSATVLAASSLYGEGLAGALGVPSLSLAGAPSLGTEMGIVLGSSAPSTVPGMLAVGLTPLSLPFAGGTLLVDPLWQLPISLAPVSTTLPFVVPVDPALLGFDVYVQLWLGDTGAPWDVSLSRGLQITFGE